MTEAEIWHNPRCSKSRQTLALLEEKLGADAVRTVRYLEQVPTRARLAEVLALLETSARDFARTGESAWDELRLDDADDATVLDAMIEHPMLIQRPVVITKRGARIGRPPEQVLEIL